MSFDEKERLEQRESEEDDIYAIFFGFKDIQPYVERIRDHLQSMDHLRDGKSWEEVRDLVPGYGKRTLKNIYGSVVRLSDQYGFDVSGVDLTPPEDKKAKLLPSASERKGFLLPQQTPAATRNVRDRVLNRGF